MVLAQKYDEKERKLYEQVHIQSKIIQRIQIMQNNDSALF
jgi:hypothetical protein